MNRIVSLLIVFLLCILGCGKKKEPLSKIQEPVSPEILSQIAVNATVENKTLATETPTNISLEEPLELKNLPPAGPYKPTNKEIQTALRNAGYYDGPIDGVIGPKTRKAIESFQKDNNLKVDGIVGPKTWEKLKKYLKETVAP